MVEYSERECIVNGNGDVAEMYSDLCVPSNRPDYIRVEVTLPNNDVLLTYFAFWDTILDVKYSILPALQPKIENIQQIKCVVCDGCQQFEVSNHTQLKSLWNNYIISIIINIEHYENVSNTKVKNGEDKSQQRDAYATVPKQISGYRNKKTGKFFKNTVVQTMCQRPELNCFNDKKRNSLATQTIQTSDATTEGVVEFGVQTEPIKALRSINIIGKIVPRQYPTSNNENRHKYACVIQKAVRTWMARKKFERMLNYYNYLKQVACSEEENLKNTINIKQQQIITNLQYPTKTRDFEALYSAIHDHYEKIKNNLKDKSPESVKTENKINLRKKFKCLKEITKHRKQIKEIAEEKKIFRQLNEISKPVIMTRSNGKKTLVETVETNQAKQFMELFINLKRTDLNKQDRIKLLENFQTTLKRFKETDLTKPVIDLLSRELTMLKVVQLNDDQLQILRKRIEIAIQWILKQPEINPAIAKTSKPVTLIKCYSCKMLKSLNKFEIKSDLKKMTTCKDCEHLHCITTKRKNLTPYDDMLKNIKTIEAQLCAKSSLIYTLNTEDIHYLVTIIWKGKSAISECKDITCLRLVRWNIEQDWSPSNTILLTIEEAHHHSKIRNIHRNYTSTFIDSVHVKHMIAKKYYKDLTRKVMEFDRNIKIQKYINNN